MSRSGTIILDIDGTITDEHHMIPSDVVRYFETLFRQGWQFVFLTGRIFSFALMTLEKLKFPYLLAVQNGADLLEMPKRKRVSSSYFNIDVVHFLDRLYEGKEEDFIVYSGYEKGDFCYYRPTRFSSYMLEYFEVLKKLSAKPWRALDTFDIKEQSFFPLIKCIGSEGVLRSFSEELKDLQGMKTSVIQDPISVDFHLILLTHKDANKGVAFEKLSTLFALPSPFIAAGNDNNDLPFLQKADVKIVMDGAPQALKDLAHILAPPSSQSGIIVGLEEAIKGA